MINRPMITKDIITHADQKTTMQTNDHNMQLPHNLTNGFNMYQQSPFLSWTSGWTIVVVIRESAGQDLQWCLCTCWFSMDISTVCDAFPYFSSAGSLGFLLASFLNASTLHFPSFSWLFSFTFSTRISTLLPQEISTDFLNFQNEQKFILVSASIAGARRLFLCFRGISLNGMSSPLDCFCVETRQFH